MKDRKLLRITLVTLFVVSLYLLLFSCYTLVSAFPSPQLHIHVGNTVTIVDMMGVKHTIENTGGSYDPVNPDYWFCHGEHDDHGFAIAAWAVLGGTETRPELWCYPGDETLYFRLVLGQTIDIPDDMPFAVFLPVVTR